MNPSEIPCTLGAPLSWETIEKMHGMEVSGQSIGAETLETFQKILEETAAPSVMAFLHRVARLPGTPHDQSADTYWALVNRLQREPTEAIFVEMARWSESSDADVRLAAIHVLGQLGYSRKDQSREKAYPFAQPTAAIIERLLGDHCVAVICAALVASGHLRVGNPDVMVPLVGHADTDVRFDLAFALLTRDEPEARAILIRLSTDTVASVRDWATFGLGRQSEVDSPAIRDALAARLYDSDADTRAEAIKGLAQRQDDRALPAMIEMLSAAEFDVELLDLAKAWPNAALLPILERIGALRA